VVDGVTTGEATPAAVLAFAADIDAAIAARAAATVAALSGVPPCHPGSGHGYAGPSDFELVKSSHVFTGVGGVREASKAPRSELPSSIG
jgi:hypothetical protein